MADYTLLQAQQDVATLRGQIAHLLVNLPLTGQAGTPVAPVGGALLFADSNNNLERMLPSGRNAVLSDSSTDHTSNVVTQATFTTITASWGIPANDPNNGTCYRL